MGNKTSGNIKKPAYIDLLYMTSNAVTAKDIATLLLDSEGLTIELWDEMNILELELSNKNTMDFEPLNIHFKDPSDAAFVKNRNIQSIFAINLSEEDLTLATPHLEKIVAQFSGFVCADTPDFKPVYIGDSQRSN